MVFGRNPTWELIPGLCLSLGVRCMRVVEVVELNGDYDDKQENEENQARLFFFVSLLRGSSVYFDGCSCSDKEEAARKAEQEAEK